MGEYHFLHAKNSDPGRCKQVLFLFCRSIFIFLIIGVTGTGAFAAANADITITSTSPNPVVAGNTVRINFNVTNTGTTSQTFGVGGEIRQGSSVLAGLGTKTTSYVSPGYSSSGYFDFVVPSGWSGTYTARVAVWTGSPGSSTWLDSYDRDFTVQAQSIDGSITVSSISTVVSGNAITVSYTVTNSGNVSHSFGVGCEIRQGSTVRADLGTQTTPSISPGANRTGSFSYTIPAGWSGGTYTARAVLWSGTPGSSTWLDNYDRDFTVQAQNVDGSITVASISTVIAGNSVTINYTVTNDGNVSHSFGVGCEIRQGSTVRADLGTQTTSSISPGANRSGSFSYTVPSGWSGGTYTARAVLWSGTPGSSTWLDSYDRDFTVQAQSIDGSITVSSISTVVSGNSITVSYTVTNSGNVSHSFGVGCEIRRNDVVQADLGAQTTAQIGVGSNSSGSFVFDVPAYWTAGTYIARAVLWTGTPGSSTWLDSYDRSFQVENQSPELTGRIALHRDSDNHTLHSAVNSDDGNVFIYNPDGGLLSNVTQMKSIGNCMNPDFAPDGSALTFMAIPSGETLSWANMRVFVFDLAQGELVDLGSGQDPKFSADGLSIVYKKNEQLWQMNRDGSSNTPLTSSEGEKSGPNFSPVIGDNRIVYWNTYWVGSSKRGDIAIRYPSGAEQTLVYGSDTRYCYYPMWRDADRILYTVSDGGDDLYEYVVSTGSNLALPSPLNGPSEDADPFPVNDLIGFSSTRVENSGGGYDLYLASATGTSVQELTEVSSSLHELGGSYTPYGHSRKLVVLAPIGGETVQSGTVYTLQVQAYSDRAVWSGVDITVKMSGPTNVSFAGLNDNGTSGDQVAGDGIYSITITLPSVSGDYTVGASAISIDNGLEIDIVSNSQSVTLYDPTGSLQVTLEPDGAITAGAQWRVDGGAWHNSGYTQTGLKVGQHEVSFNSIVDWTAPSPQTVTINDNLLTTATGTYVQHTGALTVTILPQEAVDAGAKWRRAGTSTWHYSGYTESEIPVGEYDVEFSDIASWTPPANVPVTVTHNEMSTVEGTYTQETGSVVVTIEPQGARDAGAQWRLDGGPWLNSGATSGGIAVGAHTVEFKPIDCWVEPDPIIVQVTLGELVSETGTYEFDSKPITPSFTCTPGCGHIDVEIIATNDKSYAMTLSMYNGSTQMWSQPVAPGQTLTTTNEFITTTTDEYCLTAILSGMCGNSDPATCCATPLSPPPSPNSFSSSSGCNSVTYIWNAVPGADGYCVYINGDSVWSGTETSHEFTGLEPVVHMFTVASYNECGPGEQSTGLGKTPLAIPDVPSWCTASDNNCGYISLSWENVERDGGYVIYRDGSSTPIDTVPHDTTNYFDSTIGQHDYAVSAFNYTCGESEKSSIATGVGRAVPSGSQPSIEPLVNRIEITWPVNSAALSYELRVTTPESVGDMVVSLSGAGFVFALPTDSIGLATSGLYGVELTCINDCGRSDPLTDSIELYHIGGEVLFSDPGDHPGPYWVYIGSQEGLYLSAMLSVMDSALTNDSGLYRFVIPSGSYRVWCELDTIHVQDVDVVDAPIDDVNLDVATGVDDIDESGLPNTFSLSQNYPNPFNPTTQIEFEIPRASFVEIHIYNTLGQQLRILVSERLSAGRKVVSWDGTDDGGMPVASGIYFYRISTDGYAEAKKMILLK
ncbi:exported hypothetical protein [Candidatus Zixiibacteriota bacterium]|nr:exported hypothetical protein [candidate division Zixibacteria bacterium]